MDSYKEWKKIVETLYEWKESFSTKSCSVKMEPLKEEETEYGEHIVLQFPFGEDIMEPTTSKPSKGAIFVPKKMSKEEKLESLSSKQSKEEEVEFIGGVISES